MPEQKADMNLIEYIDDLQIQENLEVVPFSLHSDFIDSIKREDYVNEEPEREIPFQEMLELLP